MKGIDSRAQAHVLEAVTAGIIVVGVLIFAVQATAITPLTVSTSHQHVETQQKKMADGVLENAKYADSPGETNALKHAVLEWDLENQEFFESSPEGHLGSYPDNRFGDLLQETFEDRRVATNVYVTYSRPDGQSGTEQMIGMGNPSDNALSATTNIVLYDDDKVTVQGDDREIGNTDRFYAPNIDEDSTVYNVVEVRIELWRI